ncbi:hypothetical protein EJ06DRAFT_517404 [Trichodelitschia bisporula]|uniref:Signal recognition particle receptor subunit beta n=1 Tax=Trichodelitschia bisporula TaxID=703511 RepID=A0A6G1HIL1_9PEZI|nr:hypothetical protein EJ06DRAFT_517404 [Trichodelitschia bisporula]
MAWHSPDGWLTQGLAPHVSTITITFIITLALPIFVHWYLYRSRAATVTPKFLVLGPSGAGKTALITTLERGAPTATHTSLTPLTIAAPLPATHTPSSARYRSTNDAALRLVPILFTDTPGHGKLRHLALGLITPAPPTPPPTGLIFVVDAAALSSEADNAGLRDAAEYLHDVLLALQRAYERAKSSVAREIPLVVVAGKLDLFTALPAGVVRSLLEAEIGRVRETKARGIVGVGKGGDGLGGEEVVEEGALGGRAEGKFEFGVMEEWGIKVSVVGGNVRGEGPGVTGLWDWVAGQI